MGRELHGEFLRNQEGEGHCERAAEGLKGSARYTCFKHKTEKVGCLEEFVYHCRVSLSYYAGGGCLGELGEIALTVFFWGADRLGFRI